MGVVGFVERAEGCGGVSYGAGGGCERAAQGDIVQGEPGHAARHRVQARIRCAPPTPHPSSDPFPHPLPSPGGGGLQGCSTCGEKRGVL